MAIPGRWTSSGGTSLLTKNDFLHSFAQNLRGPVVNLIKPHTVNFDAMVFLKISVLSIIVKNTPACMFSVTKLKTFKIKKYFEQCNIKFINQILALKNYP